MSNDEVTFKYRNRNIFAHFHKLSASIVYVLLCIENDLSQLWMWKKLPGDWSTVNHFPSKQYHLIKLSDSCSLVKFPMPKSFKPCSQVMLWYNWQQVYMTSILQQYVFLQIAICPLQRWTYGKYIIPKLSAFFFFFFLHLICLDLCFF